jgi:NAD(P)-dependent dehydrogenase (short-subunit alcohol dehydrogenase family)
MRSAAFITGGGRGIGAATATTLAQAGWDLLLTYVNDAQSCERVAELCREFGGQCVTVQGDVASESDVLRMFAAFDQQYSSLGALINNAGIVGQKTRVDELTVQRIERMFAVNVTGTMLCCREGVRRMSTMRGGQGGVIVNVSSAASRLGSPGEYVDYAASKGAVDAFTHGLALEVATEGIRVNTVRPGLIDTEIHASGGQPDRAHRLAPLIPMQRIGTAQEIADTINFLCSSQATFITASTIDVSGGR